MELPNQPILSLHAVDQYRERVKPGLSFRAAHHELAAVVAAAVPSEKPDWCETTVPTAASSAPADDADADIPFARQRIPNRETRRRDLFAGDRSFA